MAVDIVHLLKFPLLPLLDIGEDGTKLLKVNLVLDVADLVLAHFRINSLNIILNNKDRSNRKIRKVDQEL
jgi:hypothetical protein